MTRRTHKSILLDYIRRYGAVGMTFRQRLVVAEEAKCSIEAVARALRTLVKEGKVEFVKGFWMVQDPEPSP